MVVDIVCLDVLVGVTVRERTGEVVELGMLERVELPLLG